MDRLTRASAYRKSLASGRPALEAGLACLIVLSLLFQVLPWDQAIAAHYWSQGHNPWPGRDNAFGAFAYHWGQWPALLSGLLGGLVFLGSYRFKRLQLWRGRGLFLFLLLALGPGLLVNGLGKALMGRPRPSEVIDYGGFWAFQRPWHLGIPGRGGSFPSGHASMGFYWLGLYFLLPGRRRWLGLGLGLVAGALMSWARIAQGGHFLSDTLLAGALVFCLAAILAPLIQWQPQPGFWRRRQVLLALGCGLAGYGLISQVVYEERALLWTHAGAAFQALATQRLTSWQGSAPLDRVALDLSLQRGDLSVLFNARDDRELLPLNLQEQFRGLGLPLSSDRLQSGDLGSDPLFMQGPGTLSAKVVQVLSGAWWSVQGSYALGLPEAVAVDARLSTAHGRLDIGHLPADRQVLLTGDLHLEDLPVGFKPYGDRSWLREGAQPQIALSLSAPQIHFEP
jgi:lipid A 4'-phosphatase